VLLVVEIKTDLVAVEATLRKLDEKVRLAPKIAAKRFGWDAAAVARLLVVPESSTLRRRVQRHAYVLGRAFPTRGYAVRKWLARPRGQVAGLRFLSPSNGRGLIRTAGGPQRVRVAKRSPETNSAAG
jgi:hypothetical protein